MMTASQVKAFLQGHAVHGFDPETGENLACVEYHRDGTCTLRFTSGETESGVYGFEDDTYWTRYEAFRDGLTNAFQLEKRGPGVAQAYHTDGRLAYLQSHSATLPQGLLD